MARAYSGRRHASSSLVDGVLQRLRELAVGETEQGRLRDRLEELLEEDDHERQQREALSEQEREILLNALSFGELRVGDVMVPRADVKGVEVDAALDEVVESMRRAGHPRLIVYKDTLDEVVGLVRLMDLLPFWGGGGAFRLEDVMQDALVVPPSMRVIDLLLEMRQAHTNVAVVVDEYGGTDGLVTSEDIVQEILGDLHEPDEAEAAPGIVERGDGVLQVDARVWLEDLEERLGVRLLDADDADEVDTLGGLIFELCDHIPAAGEVVRHPAGFAFEILDADPRRIKSVLVRRDGDRR
ncbi:MAG: HlyC/CorC family transporter [Geminicoccaceae bacterium]|nr:HlyC/CorC family transporter [Geminicoccaceae bacterium]